MNDWIQVFKTGRHTDAEGREKEWGRADLDQIASSYNPNIHEAPVVIGHPENNAPAFGWVEALKREGDILYAKLKNLIPEFVDMVRRGLYKKRSIALYPDLSLRHVGFLGAMPPAIKGLEDVRFQERGQFTTNFCDIEDEWKEVMEMSGKDTLAPGKELERRIKEVMRNPPSVDKYGRQFSGSMTYSEAFAYVQQEDPELALQYAESLRPKLSRRGEKIRAAGDKLSSLVDEKMNANKNLSFSEAFAQVQKENVELTLEYLGQDK